MVEGVNVITSTILTDHALSEVVSAYGEARGIDSFVSGQIFHRGAQLWISVTAINELGYELEEIGIIEAALGDKIRSCLLIECNDDPDAWTMLIDFLLEFSKKYRTVLDDCNGNFYDRQGIVSLSERGYI